jgi:hypothetical protein
MIDQLFIAGAKLMPEDMLLDEVSKAVENYKVFKTKESKMKLEMFVLLLSTRFATEGKDLSTTLKMFEEHSQTMNLFKNKEQ